MISSVCYAGTDDYSKASDKALQAFYVQTGLSDYVDSYGKYLDKEYMPEDYRGAATTAFVLLQCGVRQQIGWKWSF